MTGLLIMAIWGWCSVGVLALYSWRRFEKYERRIKQRRRAEVGYMKRGYAEVKRRFSK